MGDREHLLFVLALMSAPVVVYRAVRKCGWSVIAGGLAAILIAAATREVHLWWLDRLHSIMLRTLRPGTCTFGLDVPWRNPVLAIVYASAPLGAVFFVKAFGGRWHHALAAGVCLAIPSPIGLHPELIVLLLAVASARVFYRDPHWSLAFLSATVLTYLQLSINSIFYLGDSPPWTLESVAGLLIPVIALRLPSQDRGSALWWSRAVSVIGILTLVPLSHWYLKNELAQVEANAWEQRSRGLNHVGTKHLRAFGENNTEN